MIGINDDRFVFTLADATIVANFAKSSGLGLITYWAFQRDRQQSTAGLSPLNSYSGVAQSDFGFYNIFKTASGSVASAPVATVPIVTAPASTLICSGATNWVRGQYYVAGSTVAYQNKYYQAKFGNPGYDPIISTYYWAASSCSSPTGATASSSPTPVRTPATVTATTCTGLTDWVRYKVYAQGSFVKYLGIYYVAKYRNPGYDPTISTYYWAKVSCN